jgi:hypothetical protein
LLAEKYLVNYVAQTMVRLLQRTATSCGMAKAEVLKRTITALHHYVFDVTPK